MEAEEARPRDFTEEVGDDSLVLIFIGIFFQTASLPVRVGVRRGPQGWHVAEKTNLPPTPNITTILNDATTK